MLERMGGKFVQSLYELTLMVGTTLDLEHEIEMFMEWLDRSFRPRVAFLFLTDDTHQFLRMAAAHPRHLRQNTILPMGHDPWVWLETQGLTVEDETPLHRYAVPISTEGQILGMLCLVSSASTDIVEDERTVVEAGAGYLAPVLRNIWRYRTLERKVAERTAALAQREAMFRALVEQSVVGVYLVAGDRFLYVNQAFAQMMGYEASELIEAYHPIDLVHPDDRARVEAAIRKHREEDVPAAHYAFRVLHRDGHVVHVEVYGRQIEYQGRPAILGMVIDVSERVQVEEAYHALVEHSLQGLVIVQDNRVVFANPAFLQGIGYSRDEVVGQPMEKVLALVHPEDRDRVQEVLAAAQDDEADFPARSLKFRYRRADGRMRWGRAMGSRITYQGKPAIQMTFLDITRQEESRRQLERYARFLELGNTIVHHVTHATDIDTLLSTTLDLLLQHLEVDIGAAWIVRQPGQMPALHRVMRGGIPEDDPRLMTMLRQLRHAPHLLEQSIVISDCSDPAQSPHPALREGTHDLGIGALLAVPLFARQQRVGGLVVASRAPRAWSRDEIALVESIGTEIGVAVERLRLIADLEEALRAKDEMIQDVSHELRTPLTMILGYAELLQEGLLGSLSADQMDAVNVIHRAAQRLHFMVERLLLLRTLSEENLEVETIVVGAWLNDVQARWFPQFEEHGMTLDVVADEGLVLRADRRLLDEVIDNLLHNAIKFSPKGGTVRVRAWQEGDDIFIAVADEGVGIPPDKLDRIFDRFYQVSQGLSRRFEGMGIGLALCKEIIELHGGRIWAESEGEGKGSTFYIALPASV